MATCVHMIQQVFDKYLPSAPQSFNLQPYKTDKYLGLLLDDSTADWFKGMLCEFAHEACKLGKLLRNLKIIKHTGYKHTTYKNIPVISTPHISIYIFCHLGSVNKWTKNHFYCMQCFIQTFWQGGGGGAK